MPGLGAFLAVSLAASATCIAAETKGSDSGRPRGVAPEFAKFYKDPNTFACISLPSITVPASAINDDYCDCPDGSDEPGTSACSHLSSLSPESPYNAPPAGEPQNMTPALPGFYCKNKGHIPAYLPSLAVNDGKCDYDYCCDGSDEWAGVGGISCPDKCKDIGKEWKRQDEARKKSLTTAVKLRKELLKKAVDSKGEIQQKIANLEREVKENEAKVTQLEQEVVDLEKKESLKVIRGPGKGSRTTTLAGLTKGRIEELRESLSSVREQRDAQRARVQELEGILSTFKIEYNPNFNDEGVKRAVRSWEDYAAKEQQGDWEPAHDRDIDEFLKEDNEHQGINWAEWETEGEDEGDDDVAALYNLRNYLPPSVRIFIAEKLATIREILTNNGVLAPSAPSDTSSVPESAALTEARSSLSSARSSLTSTEKDLSNTRSDLERPYGPSDIFRSLKDTCVETESGEYIYKHCYLSKLTQKPKRGGGDTNMGNFVDITTISASEVDASLDPEDLSAAPAVGPGAVGFSGPPGDRVVINYANGQGCWNGPARSTRVILGCAEKEVIWRIRESEKCVYEVWAGSVAVCPDSVSGKKASKDEL